MACVSGGDRTLTPQQVAGVVQDLGPPSGSTVAEWVAKSRQESNHRPECVNEIGAVGLFQVRDIHFESMRGRVSGTFNDKATFRAWLKDPRNNFQASKILYQQAGGWGPWRASGGRPRPNAADTAAAGAPDDSSGLGRGVGDTVEGAVDTALDPLERIIGPIIDTINKFLDWVGDPHNWARVAYVIGGGALAIVALNIVMKPVVEPIEQNVTRAAKAVVTKGVSEVTK